MNFIISHFNFYKDGSKQEKYKVDLFAIIKSCLYLILIDRFLISVDVYCAESSDFDLIEKESKCLLFQDSSKTVNDMTDKLTLGSKSTNDEVEFKDKEDSSTSETDNSSSNNDSSGLGISNLQSSLLSIQEFRIPNVIKAYKENKDLHNKVFGLIEKIKSKVESYDNNLIGKIEEKMKKKQSVNSMFNEVIQDIKTESQTLQLGVENFKKEIDVYKTLKYSYFLKILAEHIDPSLSDFDSEIKILLHNLDFSKFCFSGDKKEYNATLMILTKVLELTPEEFKKDEEVSKAILSLNY